MGDRAVREARDLEKGLVPSRRVRRSIAMLVRALRREDQVDIAVAAAALLAGADDEETARRIALVDEMVPVAAAGRPADDIARPNDLAPLVLDEHGFALDASQAADAGADLVDDRG